ncbi:MAG: DUF3137 domain-containing protein [Alphaproteobacteria bacterium]
MGLINAGIHIGGWLDRQYYKVFPNRDDGFNLGDKHAETGNGAVTDFRGVGDEEFMARVKPDLNLLEKLRQAKYRVYQWRKKIAIPVCAVLLPITGYIDYLLLWLQRGNDDGAAGLTVLVAGAIYWWVTQPKRDYARGYKEKILPKLAKMFGEFIYDIDGRIDMGVLEPSKIIPSHDKYYSEDYFKGTYKGVAMEFSEIKLTETRGSGKNRRTVTKFNGLCILLDMQSKKFLGHTTLQKDAGKITEWFKEKSSKMKRARMADPEFEKMFDAYTNDQVEARYLIDPLMIEDLKALYEEYEGNSLAVAWYDSKMLVMIASKHNHFEAADISIPATNPKSILNMKHEIGQILSIVDRLDLYDPLALEEERRNEAVLEEHEKEIAL